MPKKKTPVTFDAWLGKIVDDETAAMGGRAAVASWIGASEQTVNRRGRGEAPYLAREITIVSEKTGVPAAELVQRALRGYGGIEKLIEEYAPKSEPVANIADYRKPDLATAPEEELKRGSYAAGADEELDQDEHFD